LFNAAAGGALCPVCGPRDRLARPISLNALKVLRFLQDAPTVNEAKIRLDPRLSKELEGILTEYITYLLEGEVKSMRFLRGLKSKPA
jgi:DNA repair protein RecO (recombination protein O)